MEIYYQFVHSNNQTLCADISLCCKKLCPRLQLVICTFTVVSWAYYITVIGLWDSCVKSLFLSLTLSDGNVGKFQVRCCSG